MDCVPVSDFVPDQAPEATQDVALVLDQLSEEEVPDFTLLGAAVSVTAGDLPETVTVAACVAEPPAPVQLSSNSVVLVKMPVDHVPLVGTLPCQPPEAVQDVASADFHVRVELPPVLTVVGVALNVIDVAVGVATDTDTDSAVVPPDPLQASV